MVHEGHLNRRDTRGKHQPVHRKISGQTDSDVEICRSQALDLARQIQTAEIDPPVGEFAQLIAPPVMTAAIGDQNDFETATIVTS